MKPKLIDIPFFEYKSKWCLKVLTVLRRNTEYMNLKPKPKPNRLTDGK